MVVKKVKTAWIHKGDKEKYYVSYLLQRRQFEKKRRRFFCLGDNWDLFNTIEEAETFIKENNYDIR